MAKNKTRIADATRCLMCYQPICDIACQKKVFPAGIIHALHLKNEAGAYLRSAENVSCLHCDDAKCEKACARGRVDSPIRIQEICRYVSQMKNISRQRQMCIRDSEWTVLARMAEEAGADLIECNFSCPQMAKQGLGSDIGQDQDLIALYTRATRKGSRLPIIAKMTPNIGNMELPAMTAIANGANSLAAINTVKSITRINTENFSSYPDIGGQSAVGGYSGQAVKPIALRFIRDLASYPPLKGIPLFGIGGITTWQDALDFILLGCTALQVCTSVMEYGYRIIDHLKEGLSIYMKQHDIASLDELRGLALPNLVQPEQLDRERKLHCEIDSRRCIHCGRCYISCLDGGHQAIGWEKRTPMIDKSLCVGCGLCTLVCPTEAISLVNSL